MSFRADYRKMARASINNMDCFVLIGDSLASGGVALKADVTGGYPAAYYDVDAKAKILYKNDRTSESATLGWLNYDSDENRAPGYQAPTPGDTAIGFDDSFMYYMRQNAKKNIGLIKWGLGGTTAKTEWDVATPGTMWQSFRDYYAPKGIGKAIDIGYYNPTVKAVIICLGTNDVIQGTWVSGAAFTTSCNALIAALKAALGQPSLPIYWLQIRADLYLSGLANYPQANVNAARAVISGLSGVTVLDYESATSTVDTVHYDADSCDYIGLQMGGTLISLVT